MILEQATIYQQSIDGIIRRALRIIGKGEQIEQNKYSQAFTALQMLMNKLNSLGVKIWAVSKKTFELSFENKAVLYEGKSYLSLQDQYSDITNAPGTTKGLNYWVEGGDATTEWAETTIYSPAREYIVNMFTTFADNFQLWVGGKPKPLKHLSREEFNKLEVIKIGEPEYVFCQHPIEISDSNLKLLFHPIPDMNNYFLTFDYVRYIQPPGGIQEGLDIPPNWQTVLTFGLAAELAYEYGLNPDEIVLLETKARNAYLEAKPTNFERNDCHIVTSRF